MNDGQHSQMAYQSSETLKQEYESQGQGQGQAQGQADKTEVSEATVLFKLAVLVHASVDAHPTLCPLDASSCRAERTFFEHHGNQVPCMLPIAFAWSRFLCVIQQLRRPDPPNENSAASR